MDVWNWTFVFLSRNLLLASSSQYRLLINSDNGWTEQKRHILNTKNNKEASERTIIFWACARTLSRWETQGLGFRKKERVLKRRVSKKWFHEKEGGLKKRWRMSWLGKRFWKWGKILKIREMSKVECWGIPRDFCH